MKRKISIAAGILTVCLMVVLGLSVLQPLVKDKFSVRKYGQFFEQEADFDVLLLGNSHMADGVYPMELWQEYGITSYNFGGYRNLMAPNYWILKNALDHTSPKLVVVDCSDILNEAKRSYFLSFIHLDLDQFPLGVNKIRAAADLANNVSEFTELLWDFALYHGRWSELTTEDFHPQNGVEMGSEMLVAVAKPDKTKKIADDQKAVLEGPGVEYLKRIITECEAEGIDVMLTYLPFPAQEYSWREANTVADLAKEYGVEYLNFLQMDVVDYDTDCYDPSSHLNVAGAQKVTSVLGSFISERYSLPDHRSQDEYTDWHDAYQIYTDVRHSLLAEQEDWHNVLMLLQHPTVGAVIRMENEMLSSLDSVSVKLLAQLGIDEIKAVNDGVWIVENKQAQFAALGDTVQVQAGELSFDRQKKKWTLEIKGVCTEIGTGAAVIAAYDCRTGEMIGTFSFDKQSQMAIQ